MLLSAWRVVLMRISDHLRGGCLLFSLCCARTSCTILPAQCTARNDIMHMVEMILDIHFASGHIANFGLWLQLGFESENVACHIDILDVERGCEHMPSWCGLHNIVHQVNIRRLWHCQLSRGRDLHHREHYAISCRSETVRSEFCGYLVVM